jgi:hypothetical protein
MQYWNAAEAEGREGDGFHLASLGLSLLETSDLSAARPALRRAAEIFEWLAPDRVGPEYSMLSGMLYQLAGLPAIARTIALSNFEPSLAHVVMGDFIAAESSVFQATRILGSDPVQQPTLISGNEPGAAPQDLAKLLISSMAIMVTHMRWGDGRINTAANMLKNLSTYYMFSSDRLSWLLSKSFTLMYQTLSSASLRTVCSNLLPQLSPAGNIALERYLREAYKDGRSIAWPSQILGVEELVQGGDFAMCTPTGSGKTTIAELAIIQALFSGNSNFLTEATVSNRLVLYIVPSRALAHQVERRLKVAFSHSASFPVQVVSSYGGTDVSPLEHWSFSQRGTVIVCTQEKADALLRTYGATILANLRLLIVDEAHSIHAEGRGNYTRPLHLEELVARLRASSTGNICRTIALSAVVSDSSSLTNWISPDRPVAIESEYRSTRQAFGRLTVSESGHCDVEYDVLNGLPLGNLPNFRPTLKDFVPHFSRFHERSGSGPIVQLRAVALWVAAHLSSLDRPDSGSVLVSVGSRVNVFAKDFIQLLDTWDDLPEFFDRAKAAQSEVYRSAQETTRDYFGEESFEYRLLERGVIVHHGKLPLRMAQIFTMLIESRNVRIVIANQTLSAGVNLPFETVLFPGLQGHTGDRMPVEYVRNVVGRAGRPGVAREGRALVLVGTGARFRQVARDYRLLVAQLSAAITPQPPESALDVLMTLIFEEWRALDPLNENADQFDDWLERTGTLEVFQSPDLNLAMDQLDGFIVSAISEFKETSDITEASASAVEERLRNLWAKTFCHALHRDHFERAFANRGRNVFTAYICDDAVRRSYQSTLGPRSTAVLLSNRADISAILRTAVRYLLWQDAERLEFLEALCGQLVRVTDFDFRDKFRIADPHWGELLAWWMKRTLFIPQPGEIGRWYGLANEAFAFKMSWAVGSAILTSLPEVAFGETLGERVQASGTPWLALWLRDMLTLGCLDPIQAAVYGSSLANTREEAASIAAGYYALNGNDRSDSILDYSTVSVWLARRRTEAGLGRDLNGDLQNRYAVEVIADNLPQGTSTFRVWPQVNDGGVLWREVSGYPIASSTENAERMAFSHDLDYSLDTLTQTVTASPYL